MAGMETKRHRLYFRTVESPFDPGSVTGFWVMKDDAHEVVASTMTTYESEEAAVKECADVFMALLIVPHVCVIVEDPKMKDKVFGEIVRQKEEREKGKVDG